MTDISWKDHKKDIIVAIFIVIVIVLLVSLVFLIWRIKAEKSYRESFENGLNLGIGINAFDMKNEVGLISNNDYEEFKRAYDDFYFNPSRSNFDRLEKIMMKNIIIEDLQYGKDVDGMMDGLFVGDTKTSMETLHRNKIISNEMYAEYKIVIDEIIENPNHEKVNKYVDYMKDLYKKIKDGV